MKSMPIIAMALLAAALPSASQARRAHSAGHCRAKPAQQYLGQFGSPEIAAKARDAAGANVVRWLWPGTITTMDYDPGRIDIVLSEARLIHAIRCG